MIISCLLSLTHQVVPHAVLRYRKAHPGVEIHLSEGLGSDVHEDVRSGFADFGIGNAVALSQEIVTEEIVQESCFAVLPSTHRLRSNPSLALRDLENEEFVSLPTSSGLRRQLVEWSWLVNRSSTANAKDSSRSLQDMLLPPITAGANMSRRVADELWNQP